MFDNINNNNINVIINNNNNIRKALFYVHYQ